MDLFNEQHCHQISTNSLKVTDFRVGDCKFSLELTLLIEMIDKEMNCSWICFITLEIYQ